MPMRQDCKHFESRSYPNGDTVRKCNLDLAPEAPWRCPDDCPSFTKRRLDVNWSYGSLVTPETPDEPDGLGDDESIAALLDAAEDIITRPAPGLSPTWTPSGPRRDDSDASGELVARAVAVGRSVKRIVSERRPSPVGSPA
ncbi:MAG: hypothetical protein Ct9H300mP12_12750 [Acidimicrobiales bacterium]|nr:MAG: hypothetical protein Ct9H300mP12_12750 [Acidimicrobiales bacterium]